MRARVLAQLHVQGNNGVVGMVLDLTNSDKYYDPQEFIGRNVRYCKVCGCAVLRCADASVNRVLQSAANVLYVSLCCFLPPAPQIPCRGRGESPDPLAVNMAVWEIRKALATQPNLYILVHCTHGFNRSGACWPAPLPACLHG